MATQSVTENPFAPGLHSIVVSVHPLALPVHRKTLKPLRGAGWSRVS